ncbi:MAG: cell wall-binding repeat-containing protein [Erysipelotrichaceae bacterium]|nr:cell wall-binding repeat-containing protein [Erysipelotrichaceae bacterium]
MRKLITIMLSVLMSLTVVVITSVEPVEASTHIDEIHITVKEPVAGEEISYDCTITSKPAHDSVRKSTLIGWLETPADDDSVQHATEMTDIYYEAGKHYHIKYGALVYPDGEAVIDSNTKIFINEKQDDGTMRFFIGKTAVKYVFVEVDDPKAGESVKNTAWVGTSPYCDSVANSTYYLQWLVCNVDDLTSDSITENTNSTYEAEKFYHPQVIGNILPTDSWYYENAETKYIINGVESDGKHMRFYTGKELTRIYGDNRYKTSMAIADVMKREWQPGSEYEIGLSEVIIASAENFADALAVSYAAFNSGAEQPRPIVVVNEKNQDLVEKYIRDNFQTDAQVYIIGGTKAVPEKIEKNLKKDYSVKRIAGTNRYDTNLKILETFGVSKHDTILIATGTNFADSLSASATGIPMLLVGSSLNDDQKMFLQRNKDKWIYILGGTGAVSETVEKQIKEIIGGSPARISGANRYETSALIAREFFQGCSGVAIAFGGNFPDGLCGGPLAGRLNAPLLLVGENESQYKYARKFVKDFHVDWGYAFGGSGVISNTLFKKVLREQGVCPIHEVKHE